MIFTYFFRLDECINTLSKIALDKEKNQNDVENRNIQMEYDNLNHQLVSYIQKKFNFDAKNVEKIIKNTYTLFIKDRKLYYEVEDSEKDIIEEMADLGILQIHPENKNKVQLKPIKTF